MKGTQGARTTHISPAEIQAVKQKATMNLVAFRYLLLSTDASEVLPPEYHYDWSDALLSGKRNEAIEGFRESGKALPLDTEIPTPYGFKTINELNIGDIVYDMDGKEASITIVSEVFENKDCYKLCFDDGSDIVCSGDHLWYIFDKKKRKFVVISTLEMAKDYQGWAHKNGYQERRFRLPLCKAVEYRKNKLLIDPYVLGFWLGDGNSDCSIFTIGDRDAKEVSAEFLRRGYSLKRLPSDTYRYSITGIRNEMRSLNLIMNKHIPEEYLLASVEDRIDLLCGLIDSDGCVDRKGTKAGTVTFSNMNKRLASEVLELVRSLGWKATLINKPAKLNGKICGTCWYVAFKPDICVSKLKYKYNLINKIYARSKSKTVTKIEKVPSVLCKCIGVNGKNNTYLATRNYIVTHNTQIVLRAFLLYCLVFPCKERDYIVLIKNNATLAGAKLREIEREYNSNPILSANKIKIYEESSGVFAIEARDVFGDTINVRIEAYGKGASIRGLANIDRRPRCVIIDDPQDIEDAQSETVTENDWNWFLSDVMFLGQNTRLFLIGNNLGEKCIIERVFANAEELNFAVSKIPTLINGESAWPDKYTVKDIEQSKEDFRKLGKLDIWFREKMCEAISDETRTFCREDIRYYSPSLINDIASKCAIFMAVDLAISEKKSADYTAIPVIGVNPEGHWFVLDCAYGRFDPSQTIDSLFSLVKRWKPRMVGIEKVAYQKALVHFVMKEMPLRSCFFPVLELAAEKQKELRIKALQPRFKAHTMWLPEHAPWLTEMESELLMFPKGLHDDLIDAMAYIPSFAYPMNKNDALRADLVRAGIPAGDAGLEFSNRGPCDPFAVLHGAR